MKRAALITAVLAGLAAASVSLVATGAVGSESQRLASATRSGSIWKALRCGVAVRALGKRPTRGKRRRTSAIPCPRGPLGTVVIGAQGRAGAPGSEGLPGPPGAPGSDDLSAAGGGTAGYETPPERALTRKILIASIDAPRSGPLVVRARLSRYELTGHCGLEADRCLVSYGLYLDGGPIPASGRNDILSFAGDTSFVIGAADLGGSPAGVLLNVITPSVSAGHHEVWLAMRVTLFSTLAQTVPPLGTLTLQQVGTSTPPLPSEAPPPAPASPPAPAQPPLQSPPVQPCDSPGTARCLGRGRILTRRTRVKERRSTRKVRVTARIKIGCLRASTRTSCQGALRLKSKRGRIVGRRAVRLRRGSTKIVRVGVVGRARAKLLAGAGVRVRATLTGPALIAKGIRIHLLPSRERLKT